MRVSEWRVRTTERLRSHAIADAEIEAEVLLRHAMGLGRAGFLAGLNDLAPHPLEEIVDRVAETVCPVKQWKKNKDE